MPDVDWTTSGSDLKKTLDDLHKRKIDLADGIYVVNVGGYIGESTQGEIEYANSQGKISPGEPIRLAEDRRIARCGYDHPQRDRDSPGSDPLPQEAGHGWRRCHGPGTIWPPSASLPGTAPQLLTEPSSWAGPRAGGLERPGVRVDPVSGWPLGGQGQAGPVPPHLPGCHSGDLRARGRGSGHGQPGRPAGDLAVASTTN